MKDTIIPHCLSTCFKHVSVFATLSWHFFIYEIYLDSHTWGRPKPHSASGGAAWLASKASLNGDPLSASWAPILTDFPPPSKRAGSHVSFLLQLSPWLLPLIQKAQVRVQSKLFVMHFLSPYCNISHDYLLCRKRGSLRLKFNPAST